MNKPVGYVIMHNWYNTDYEEEGHELHNVLFPTKEEAQKYIDIEMAYSFNNSFNDEVEGLTFDGNFNAILATDDYGNEMLYDSWDINPLYAEAE